IVTRDSPIPNRLRTKSLTCGRGPHQTGQGQPFRILAEDSPAGPRLLLGGQRFLLTRAPPSLPGFQALVSLAVQGVPPSPASLRRPPDHSGPCRLGHPVLDRRPRPPTQILLCLRGKPSRVLHFDVHREHSITACLPYVSILAWLRFLRAVEVPWHGAA